MLTRLYIDNFRCFEKFEWRPGRKQLILGGNGTGKSSLVDVISRLRRFAGEGERSDRCFPVRDRTRWLSQPSQSLALELEVEGRRFGYRLALGAQGEVQQETAQAGDVRLELDEGEAVLYEPGKPPPLAYDLDRRRSALATTGDLRFAPLLSWLGSLSCWRINPRSMETWAMGEGGDPAEDLHNFPAWYRSLARSYPVENAAFARALSESLDAFVQLRLEPVVEGTQALCAEFCREGQKIEVPFSELSDGQRCLICLYAIAHFVAARGGTVIIDEPDNFISLTEIQPWLNRIEEMADDHDGQVILISHHPEILNQWAPSYGVEFVRDGAGAVRVEKFKGDPESPLSAAELVARGWNLD